MPGKKPSLEAEITELYGLPFEQFTAARNALAARLRGAGRKADAEAVKALAKPSLSAWAVNQLFRREDGRMEALLDAGRRARSAQRDAVAGRGAEAFREALAAARRLLEELRREAAALLAKGGKAPGAGIVERVATDLEALAFSPAAAEEGKRGYLDADLDPPGFEVLAGLQLAAAKAPAKSSPKPRRAEPASPPRPEPRKEKDRETLGVTPRVLHFKPSQKETAAAAAARRKEEAEAARRARAAAKRQERVTRAEGVVERAAEKAKARRDEAAAAEREAAAARREAEAAERAAAEAGRRSAAAEAELARAREDLAAARES